MKIKATFLNSAAISCIAVLCGALSGAPQSIASTPAVVRPQLVLAPAEHSSTPTQVPILASVMAGSRIVSVGDNGTVLLSDDNGVSFRQAKSVPVDSTLTSVWFVDAHSGWAVGHSGVVIKTMDGGDTWTLQRSDMSVDQPLFSVYFKNPQEGWAVGLWSLMLHTSDGGSHWTKVDVPPPPGSKKADRNMFSIFSDRDGTIFVACEQGMVIRSTDGGSTWTYESTGYAGSIWTGAALPDGTILVGGLRGSLFRSSDKGSSWQRVTDPYQSSITAIVALQGGSVVVTALDGVVMRSSDFGRSFTGGVRPDRAPLTAAVVTPLPGKDALSRTVYFSTNGVLR